MVTPLLSCLLAAALLQVGSTPTPNLRCVDRPPIDSRSRHYVGNRPPLAPSPLVKLPVGTIRPEGWLREQLVRQADGFVGHLGEISRFLAKEGHAWLDPEGEGHSPWEELPYWLKGYGNTGYALGDERVIEEARAWIEGALASQREDGWFGPCPNLTRIRSERGPRPDLWPNMIMVMALQSWHEHTGDERVIELMTRWFRWQLSVPEEDFLLPFWQQQRGADDLASVLWLYNRTGDEWLLELAAKVHRRTADWSGGVANWHGVNIAQGFRGPATWWMVSGDPAHLEATERDWQTVMGEYGQVPGGLWGADENCREGFTGPRQAAETCTMVETMLSCEMLLGITGNPVWADRCEDVAFNSFPASMTPDLKALHYLTAPNMIRCDAASKAPGLQNSGPMLLFDPHRHRCCQHNVAHGWPYFAEHLWMATADDGLAAVLYAPCEVRARVGEGVDVTIETVTQYPFWEEVVLYVDAPAPVRFPLYMRVPGWCNDPRLWLNDEELEVRARPGSFLRLEHTFAPHDRIRLRLFSLMDVRLKRWEANQDCVSVHRGPLTYSLEIGEEYVRAGGTDEWPAWEIHPTTDWNLGLVLDEEDPAGSFQVLGRPMPESGQPFDARVAPCELRVRARAIPAWKEDALGLVGPLQSSPARSTEPVREVSLIPMGCARLRISAFPVIGEGPDAHDWIAPPDPIRATASHCFQGDTVGALSDGLLPRSSGDHGLPRFTFWPRRGSLEWVEYRFEEEREVSRMEVYWFDDTGRGQCRVPIEWAVLVPEGEGWRELEGSRVADPAVDAFDPVAFDPVRTRVLRLEIRLREGFSAGILEWRVH